MGHAVESISQTQLEVASTLVCTVVISSHPLQPSKPLPLPSILPCSPQSANAIYLLVGLWWDLLSG